MLVFQCSSVCVRVCVHVFVCVLACICGRLTGVANGRDLRATVQAAQATVITVYRVEFRRLTTYQLVLVKSYCFCDI